MKSNSINRSVSVVFASMLLVALVFLLAGAAQSPAKPPPTGSGNGGVELKQVGDFSEPVYTASAPGKASKKLLFVVEREGTVRVIRSGTTLAKPFLDISDQLDLSFNERGLLSIAFDPGYAQNRRFYVYYTSLPDGDITVEQFRTEKDNKVVADPDSGREVISIPHGPFPNHNGGEVSFGPDGNMYLATGDGGFACDPDENAQNLDSLLGKLLRIAPSKNGGYTVPKDNPFVKRAGADEIYSYGLRNPFRFSFDEDKKTIAIGDVGQDAWEEIDYLKTAKASGANFGWDAYEGDEELVLSDFCTTGGGFTGGDTPTPPIAGTTFPILAYPHSSGDPDQYAGCAIIGGPVVRDEKLKSLYGRYLYSDSCNGGIQSVVPGVGGAMGDKPLGIGVEGPSSITEGRKHRVYVSSYPLSGGTGTVYRLVSSSGPTPTASATADDADSIGGSRTGNGGGTFPGQATG